MLLDRFEKQSFDRHATGSAAARLSPRAKLIAAGAVLVAVALVQPTWFPLAAGVPISLLHVALAVMIAAAAVAARMPLAYFLRRLVWFAIPFLLVTLSIPLTRGRAGFDIMAAVAVRGLLSYSTVLVLLYTTPFDRMLDALRQCRVPAPLVAALAATHRYTFVLLDELERMRRAQFARTFDCPRRLSLVTLRNGTRLLGMLLLRCSERAERVHAAMLARGYDGEARRPSKER